MTAPSKCAGTYYPGEFPSEKNKQDPAPDKVRISLVQNHSPRDKSPRNKFLGHKFWKPWCEKVLQSFPGSPTCSIFRNQELIVFSF